MRILLYSHDSYGLGHIQRTLAVARRLAHDFPRASQLLVTGSLQSASFDLPERLDYLKLPAISKRSSGAYRSRVLRLPVEAVLSFRESLIFDAARHFEPDVVLVDKAPVGVEGELRRSLYHLKARRHRPKLVLGMRDIEDEASVVRAEWRAHGVYPVLDDVYDAILLYGTRAIYDPVREYGLSPRAAAKVVPCGYVARPAPARPRDQLRRELNVETGRLVVVTAGGGGDGFALVRAYLDMLDAYGAREPRFDSVVVLGPLMPSAKRALLRARARAGSSLTLLDFTTDLYSYLGAADLIVSMGGYNSVCEILTLRKRAILVPRVRPRTEQLIRAERLRARELARMVHPDDLTPDRLFAEIASGLADGGPPAAAAEVGLEMDGAGNASRAIARILDRKGGGVTTEAVTTGTATTGAVRVSRREA